MTGPHIRAASKVSAKRGVEFHFPTLLWRADAFSDSAASGIDAYINAEIAEAVRDARRLDADFQNEHYNNGYTSYASNYQLKSDPRCAALKSWILREAEGYLRDIGVRTGWQAVMTSFFCTIGTQWSQHGAHRHENVEISGVYHIEAPDNSAALIVHSPLECLQMRSRHDLFKPASPWRQSRKVLPPVSGQLILFPSWLEHAVEVQRVEGERLAISVNLVVERIPPAIGL
jgi:uncharacterized protein (TIGR02466 family)